MRTRRVLLLAGLVACWLLAPAPRADAAPKNWVVNMKGMAFIPEGERLQADVTIKAGDSVTWVYSEAVTDLGCETLSQCPGHSTTGTSADKKWDSKVFGKAASPAKYPKNQFTVRFDKPGKFAYICTPHAGLAHPFNRGAGMTAQVVVQ